MSRHRLIEAVAIAMQAASAMYGPPAAEPQLRAEPTQDPQEARRRIEAAEAKRQRRQQKRLRALGQ